ncbi:MULTISPECIES: F0F1 ATP synthase subunit A [unclassified Rhodococcus (in: high G+C Gram-positive bacteria)]|uniref:F0F1 ATP synthase subunit A n=1 Tax=unclassified Rhodococcus (in: high G+C Gram-positive bacteria) TaxID=192944 RepID=UPI000B93C377|nr:MULTISPECIES: F0F1 ATP synthase subunit A [unclassified Rhodococcus (in: high G+C Gram-positive bacteria)]MCJ0906685.1 F0F1 ATP synthase subunit A [Rhodococcus sp. ARC_M6]MDI9918127.1 F0F1 ATP synthase subunit A [Rhodococcus sp. IEGM 1379]OYD71272.1 ATP synthase F0 subcomplex A subunit [Rhodococcus sp. OK302]
MMAADRLRERTLSVTTLAADEFHAPSLDDFFPPSVLIHAGPFELDRLMLIRILMSVLVAAFFAIAMRSPRLIPRGVQNVAEIALDFVRIQIAEDVLGKEQGKRFLPVITTIFFLVIASNVSAIIPFLNISPNARIGMPLVLAALAYIVFNYVGIKKYGFFKYVKSTIVVPGVPPALHVLLIPIEFISTFVLRPFTLMVRLMANMLAGHILLVLFFSATNYFFFVSGGFQAIFGVPSIIAGLAFTFFELLVIFLQAYVFALLAAVYIDIALHADEH